MILPYGMRMWECPECARRMPGYKPRLCNDCARKVRNQTPLNLRALYAERKAKDDQ